MEQTPCPAQIRAYCAYYGEMEPSLFDVELPPGQVLEGDAAPQWGMAKIREADKTNKDEERWKKEEKENI